MLYSEILTKQTEMGAALSLPLSWISRVFLHLTQNSLERRFGVVDRPTGRIIQHACVMGLSAERRAIQMPVISPCSRTKTVS